MMPFSGNRGPSCSLGKTESGHLSLDEVYLGTKQKALRNKVIRPWVRKPLGT